MELRYNTLINDANLLAYYKLENVNDSKGPNHLTNTNSVGFVSGKFNTAADFSSNNTNKKLYVNSNLGLPSLMNASVSFWVYAYSAPLNFSDGFVQTFFMVAQALGTTAYFQVYYTNGGDGFYGTKVPILQIDCGGGGVNSGFGIQADLGVGVWHHIVAVRDYSNLITRLYVDGILLSTGNINTSNSNQTPGFSIGSDTGGTNRSNVRIDDFAVFNRVLTQAEVTSLYSANVLGEVSPSIAAKYGTVILYGGGFTGTTAVSFGGVAAKSFVVDSDSQITAVVGNGATGTVSVTNPNGVFTLSGFQISAAITGITSISL